MSVTVRRKSSLIITDGIFRRAMCCRGNGFWRGGVQRENPKSLYLKPGDVVECEIEKIGVLRNPVVSYREKHGGKSLGLAA